MKNYDSKFNPFLGAGLLGAAVPVAVYLIGFIALLMWVAAITFLFPFFYGGQLNENTFSNITAIITTVFQVLSITFLALAITYFSRMKIYHVLLSVAVSSALFFLVERFMPAVRWANFPEVRVIFPVLFEKWGINYDVLSKGQFIELKIYLTTTLLLSAACALIVLIAWTIMHFAARKERKAEEQLEDRQ